MLSRSRPPGILGALPIFALGFLFGLLTLHFSSEPAARFPTISHHERPPPQARGIPPIVHFVQLKADPDAQLHFSFEAFLAFYSAYRAVRPTAIYLHTDFTPADVARARDLGSPWTRRLLTLFPDVLRLRHVVAPTHAGAPSSSPSPSPSSPPPQHALPILRVEHKSDLVRLDALAGGGGGVYLDWDVLVLRDPAPLLASGFAAVAGRQPDDSVNNGVLLARADSAVLAVLRAEAPRAFDGGWITHSVGLLTRLAAAAAGAPGRELLVLDHRAAAPFSWEQASVDALLARHEGDPAVGRDADDDDDDDDDDEGEARDPLAVWEAARERERTRRGWEYDFGDAYFLHKFFNDVEDPRGYNGVSVPYVLARDSNYAVAAWPIVRQGIRDGYIDEHDATL